MKKAKITLVLLLSLLVFRAGTISAEISGELRQRWLDDAVAAYVYGFAPVEMYRTAYQMVVSGEHQVVTGAFNRYHHSRQLATADDRWLVSPNNDTLYSNAWLDLSNGPVVLRTPDMGDRYYILQLMDIYSNNFAMLGTRTVGNGERSYWVANSGWQGEVPAGMQEVRAPSNYIWILGRLHIRAGEELQAVHFLQTQFGIEESALTSNQLPLAYNSEQPFNFYRILDVVLRLAAPAAVDQAILAKINRLGIGNDQPFDPIQLEDWQRSLLKLAETIGHQRIVTHSTQYTTLGNGWIYDGENGGRFGADYLSRAATAMTGLGVLSIEEAFYPFVFVDNEGEVLRGGRRYRLRFSAETMPDATFFWSLSAYELPQWSLIDNPIDRYSLGNLSSDLLYSPDGSLDILLQQEIPKKFNNWLPTPKEGEFSLILRIYGPSPTSWLTYIPPVVERIR